MQTSIDWPTRSELGSFLSLALRAWIDSTLTSYLAAIPLRVSPLPTSCSATVSPLPHDLPELLDVLLDLPEALELLDLLDELDLLGLPGRQTLSFWPSRILLGSRPGLARSIDFWLTPCLTAMPLRVWPEATSCSI